MNHLYEISTPPLDILYYTVIGVIGLAIVILFIIEILAKLNDTPNDNVNIIIREWAYGKFYFITFFFGIVASHLFLGTRIRWLDCAKYNIPIDCKILDVLVIAGLSIILLIIGLIFQKTKTSKTFQAILFGVGMVVGHFVWSMNDFF